MTMRSLAKVVDQLDQPPGTPLYMKKYMARPPGCSFLGAKATTTKVLIGKNATQETSIIIDSGSDITLISHKHLQSIPSPPHIHTGERINLVQVTGSTTLSGYVTLPISFPTSDGPVILEVEAYVVKGMNTPFILGNDFGDQYQLSLLRREDKTFLTFGDTGRQLEVFNSLGPSFVDEMGQSFKVLTQKPGDTIPLRIQRKNNTKNMNVSPQSALGFKVTAAEAVIIPPEKVVRVPVKAMFPKDATCLFVDRMEHRNCNLESFFGAPSSLIQREDPFLQIANFTPHPVTIQKGRLLGWGNDPSTYLDSPTNKSEEELVKLEAHSQAIKAVVSDLLDKPSDVTSGQEEERLEGELEGGPKTAEVPDPDPIPASAERQNKI